MLTHSTAVVDAITGAGLDQITVEATTEGYEPLVEFADQQSPLRAWAIEGTGGHGAGFAAPGPRRGGCGELDRPQQAQRSNVAKSDRLDAIRAPAKRCPGPASARPAAAVTGRRCRCLRPPAGSRSRPARSRNARLKTAAGMRLHPPGTPRPPRPSRCCGHWPAARWGSRKKPACTSARSWPLSRPGVPICSTSPAWVRSWPRRGCAPGPTQTGSTQRPTSQMPAGAAPIPANSGQTSTRYRPNRHGDRLLNRPAHHHAVPPAQPEPTASTPRDEPARVRQHARSDAASSARSPVISTDSSNTNAEA